MTPELIAAPIAVAASQIDFAYDALADPFRGFGVDDVGDKLMSGASAKSVIASLQLQVRIADAAEAQPQQRVTLGRAGACGLSKLDLSILQMNPNHVGTEYQPTMSERCDARVSGGFATTIFMNQSKSTEQHRAAAHAQGPVAVAIVTVSDTRTPETDENRKYLEAELSGAGHRLVAYRLIQDDPAQVLAVLEELAAGEAKVLFFNGGTGIAPRDTTYDVLSRKLEKVLPGFGELFRMFSYEQVGAAAMLSRAVAGTFRGKVVISTPGSPNAVATAWTRLIQPELEHLAWEVARLG